MPVETSSELSHLQQRAADVLGAIEALLSDTLIAEADADGKSLHSKNGKGQEETVSLVYLLGEVQAEIGHLKIEVARSQASALAAVQHERERILGDVRGMIERALSQFRADEPHRRGYSSGERSEN